MTVLELQKIYDENPQIRRVLNTLIDETFNSGSPNNADFQELFDSILKGASWIVEIIMLFSQKKCSYND